MKPSEPAAARDDLATGSGAPQAGSRTLEQAMGAQVRRLRRQADLTARDKIATDVVLARWAERCGEECAANWNDTVGKILGLTAKAN